MIKKIFYKYSQQTFLFILILFISIFLSFQSEYFFTWKNIRNIIEANTYRLILAIGMTIVISSGVMDLSAGSIISLSGIIIALLLHADLPLSVVICVGILFGMILGCINGILIHYTKINFFILTLASSGIFRGISLIITKGKPITKFGSGFIQLGIGRIGEIQYSVILAIIILIFTYIFLYHMKLGNYIQALGGNSEALFKNGINISIYRIFTHSFLGITAAITALIITARLNSAEPNAGINMDMDAITAVIMGGTPIRGGRATLLGTILAVIILGIIRNGLTLLSISSDYQQLFTGLILLLSVLISDKKSTN